MAASSQERTDFVRDEDDIFAELEAEEDGAISKFREERIRQLKQEAEKLNAMKTSRHGIYDLISTEKDILEITTSTTSPRSVVHFFHKDFRRCRIMDNHLESLAKKHFKTRFVRIDVESAPFLVERLQVRVLPCVISFKDGVAVDRIVGFEDLGMSDNFPTALLEKRLAKCGIISFTEDDDLKNKTRKTIFGFSDNQYDEDSDD